MSPDAKGFGCDCREEFKPVAAACRKNRRRDTIVGFIALVFWLLLFVPGWRMVGIVGFAACVIGGMIVSALYSHDLDCPACQKDLTETSGNFCPECGADGVKVTEIFAFGGPSCSSCGRQLATGRRGRRKYRIRFCRSCGAHVDDQGL